MLYQLRFGGQKIKYCGNGSVGRALASQAEGRGFESRLPLKTLKHRLLRPTLAKDEVKTVTES